MDGGINKDLNISMYMAVSKRLGGQNDRFLRDRLMGFQRGGKIVRSISRQMVVMKMNADVAEVKSRIDDKIGGGQCH